jgi:dTMP kinase
MSEGKFIVLEGPDGSGKSTQARLLVEALGKRGHPVEHLRDPGGTPIGEAIRRIVLDHESLARSAELFLFLAARAQLVAERIRPALEGGRIVICERFVASTFCYQVFPDPPAIDTAYLRNMFAIVRNSAGDLVPDLTVLLDVPPSVGLSRKATDGPEATLDRIERRGEGFQEKVQAGYRWLREQDLIPGLVTVPPGTVDETRAKVLQLVVGVLDAR